MTKADYLCEMIFKGVVAGLLMSQWPTSSDGVGFVEFTGKAFASLGIGMWIYASVARYYAARGDVS